MEQKNKIQETCIVKRGQLPKGINARSCVRRLPKRLLPESWLTYDDLIDTDHEHLVRRSYCQNKQFNSDLSTDYDL